MLIFALGALLRIHFSNGPGTAHDRQYRSFLIARALYFATLEEIPEWRLRVAATSHRNQETLEPPITESFVASLYRLIGGESFRAARLFTALVWLLGAFPLFGVVRKLGSADSATLSVAYYLLVPQGVLISVSFMPESLMITMLVASLLAIVRYFERQSVPRLLLAASVSGLAILIKPLVIFLPPSAYLALAVAGSGERDRTVALPGVIFFALSLGPSAVFYGRGLVGEGYLWWKAETGFLPHLLLAREFWEGWLQSGVATAGVAPLTLGLFGLGLLGPGRARALLLGLGIGYIAFCLAFNYYTRVLPYYHAQLIVIVALALGPATDRVIHILERVPRTIWRGLFVAAALGIVVLSNYYAIRDGQIQPTFESTSVAEEIGRVVEHSDLVAYVAPEYGLPLEYYGELAGEAWPRPFQGWPRAAGPEQPRSIEERICTLGFMPRYFVITDFAEFERHHTDLERFLRTAGRLVAESNRYLVFELVDGTVDLGEHCGNRSLPAPPY